MVNRTNTPTVMFWNCLGIAITIFSLGASWSISQAKIYELQAAQYKLQVGSAISKVQKVSDELEKSAERLPITPIKISTIGVPQGDIELDFNPIIQEFNLTGDYQLIHWQARPKGQREWGIYSSYEDSYRSVATGNFNYCSGRLLMLDDKTTNTLPSAVVCLETRRIICINDRVIMGDVLLADVA
jgi:hypothetical protein